MAIHSIVEQDVREQAQKEQATVQRSQAGNTGRTIVTTAVVLGALAGAAYVFVQVLMPLMAQGMSFSR